MWRVRKYNIRCPEPAEIIPSRKFYDYTSKYNDSSRKVLIPAPIEQETKELVKAMAKKVFKFLSCRGIARLDFFLVNNQLYFNEVNTMPALDPQSTFYRMFEYGGWGYKDILNRLIELALYEFNLKRACKLY